MASPYVFLELGAPVSLLGDALDSVVDTSVVGVPSRVLTPTCERTVDRGPVLVHPAAARSWSVPRTASDPARPWKEFWGSVREWHPERGVERWSANHVLMEVVADAADESEALELVEPLMDALPAWTSLLRDWVAIYSGQLVSAGLDDVAITQPYEAAGIWWDDGDRARRVSRQGVTEIVVAKTPAASGSVWARCCTLAGSGEEPPIEQTMLLEARRALAHDRHREAVVDAATAAEVVLRERVEADLRSLPPAVTRQLVPEKATLGRLASVFACSRETDDDLNHLISLRNRVVHRSALQPTSADARRAVSTAGELVAWLSPLDIGAESKER